MNRTLTTLFALGTLTVFTVESAEAGKPPTRRIVHRNVVGAMKRNTQVRNQILRDARQARLHPSVQKDLRQAFRQDAQRERQIHRDIHQSLRNVPTRPIHKHSYGRSFGGYGRSGVSITPRGIGYTSGGFSIFFGR